MTQITREDVQHLAQLSSVLLDEAQIDALRTDIEGILGHIEQLSELDTEGVEATYQVGELENVWRDDVIITEDVTRDDLVGLAAEYHDGQVKVPKVLSW